MKNENRCVIVKTRNEKSEFPSRHVGIQTDVYDDICVVAKDTGRSVRYVVSKLLAFGLANLEIAESDVE